VRRKLFDREGVERTRYSPRRAAPGSSSGHSQSRERPHVPGTGPPGFGRVIFSTRHAAGRFRTQIDPARQALVCGRSQPASGIYPVLSLPAAIRGGNLLSVFAPDFMESQHLPNHVSGKSYWA